MRVKKMSGIINHVNATILKQLRALLEADIETSDLKRRKMIRYMWESGRAQVALRKLTVLKFSPYSDDYVWFMAGYYDGVYDGCQYSSQRKPIAWGLDNE